MEPTVPPLPPSWAPVPGPVDRVSFFEEQARRRRQTWRATLLGAVAAAVVGVPLAMFLTPFAYLLGVGSLRLTGAWAGVPEGVRSTLAEIARFVPDLLSAIADSPEEELLPLLREAFAAVAFPFGSPLLTVALLVLPGMVGTVLVWLGYRALFRRAGVGGALLGLAAREPRADDPEERQLVNVVEEMAIAAGIPAPKLRLLDSAVPNGAAVGASPEDAVLVVTRGLLDGMDRDETQGVIAHLVASVGNGDLRVALSVITVFQAIELVFTVFDALFNLSARAWRDLFAALRAALHATVGGGGDPAAAEAVAHMMDRRLGEVHEDGISKLLGDAQSDRPQSGLGKLFKRLPMLQILFLPFLLLWLLTLFLRMQVSMVRMFVVGPLLMRVWRTRRFLADASAVQLTRNPDGLARGLVRLADEGGVVPGGQWFSHLFVVGPEAVKARAGARMQERMAELRSDAEGRSRLAAAAEGYRAVRTAAREEAASEHGTWTAELAGVASHPSLETRLARLDALGAMRASEAPRKDGPRAGAAAAGGRRPRHSALSAGLAAAGAALLLPLMAIALSLAAFATAAIFLFGTVAAVAFMGLAMALVYALVV